MSLNVLKKRDIEICLSQYHLASLRKILQTGSAVVMVSQSHSQPSILNCTKKNQVSSMVEYDLALS